MAITYETFHQSKMGTKTSPALTKLKSINESFQSEGISVLNEGFSEVAYNQHYFNDYVQKLSEDLEPEAAEQFAVLAENTRQTILTESSISGVSPVTALSLPLLRIAFPKTAVREGMPTEPVMQPKFKVAWLRPWVKRANGEKVFLPKALKTDTNLFTLPKVHATDIAVGAAGAYGFDLFNGTTGNVALGDSIDPNFRVTEVVFKALDAAGANAENKTVAVDLQLDTNINVCEGVVTANHTDGTENKVRVFAKVNRDAGTVDIIGMNREIVSIKVLGYISSEMNNHATQAGFDITSDETHIGTGQPIESPINMQQMTDTMAMYNIDSTVRTLEYMSTTLAQSTDLQGIQFLTDRFAQSNPQISAQFDIVPPANYLAGPTAWREEIKRKIDNQVMLMMEQTNYTSGSAVIFGHMLDTAVIHNVRWQYAVDEQPNGVNVEYKVGVYESGVTKYKVLSSMNFPKGSLYIVFVPNDADQKTFMYYPYSFNVIRGAQSGGNTPNLPVVQMIKRHIFKSYVPMIAKLELLNNNGSN